MTPDEDKPVEYSCYTVIFNEWRLCVPISAQNISQLPSDDFMDEESWIVPVEYRRGQDIADIWNAQRDARAKIVAAYNEKRKQLE